MARNKRRFGTIRKLPSGRYQALFTDSIGTRVVAPHTFTSATAAEKWLRERRAEVESGRHNPAAVIRPAMLTFGDYALRWLANRHVSGRPIKPQTRAGYQAILDHHLIPAFGPEPIAAITPKDVRDWYALTLTDRPTMRSHAYSLLRTILGSAVNHDLIAANPAHIVGAGRAKRVVQIRPASVAQLATATAAMPERLALMVTLGSWTALRFGEIVELRRGDVDLTAKVIRIRRAAVRVGGTFQVGTPKSEASVRDVAVPPHIMPLIENHLSKYVGPDRDSMLFPATSGGHLQPSTLSRHWHRARTTAGRPDLRWHDLRHTGLTLAAATGATLAELMGRAGHSTPTAALRYQHIIGGRDAEIAALLSKLADVAP
jgi:integrase